jgi:15-cis-phytoene synthase
MTPTVVAGYASAREVTRHHAKSFYFSSVALFGARRRGAFAIYAFCRRLDDLVDQSETDPKALPGLLDEARGLLYSLFVRGTVKAIKPWPEHELVAFLDAAERFGLVQQPFLDLVAGMEMDLTQKRYASWAELDLYCYRVAGTVGLMMAPLLGSTDPIALGHAADLGRAMQLTNILRDVKEDLGLGRVYLPQDELAAHGLSEADLKLGVVDARVRSFLTMQIARARTLYASALKGVPYLRGFGSQRVVRLMSSIYGGILDVIEERDFDIFSSRVSLPTRRKVWRLAAVLATPNPRR